jgi:hypothetical protein
MWTYDTATINSHYFSQHNASQDNALIAILSFILSLLSYVSYLLCSLLACL